MKNHQAISMAICALMFGILACTFGQTSPPPTGPAAGAATQTESQPQPLRPPSGEVVDPAHLEYLGAFRLPGGEDRPQTFGYGGNAMTFNPDGDPSGAQDGFPGSLFITGHDRLPYGELLDGGRIAEVSIPIPTLSRNVTELLQAGFLQGFTDVLAGRFARLDEIPRIGLLYLNYPVTGPQVHVAYGQHFETDPASPTHGWFSPNFSSPDFQGEWFLGGQSFYSVNDYMFEIPSAWADAYVQGRVIATGRFRDGGWSGMGPVIIAYRPWDANGSPPSNGASLDSITLLQYAASTETENFTERSLSGYQHPDEWNGGAWLTTASGKSAVLFVGTKSNGTKFWYGYVNPAGPELPCVDEEITDFPTCRMADGSVCPQTDFVECSGHNDYRGWWTTHWDTQFIFYDPADLARVATGELSPWEPQPYAVLDIDEQLFFNPSGVELDMLGSGDQRRYRIGDVAYDRANGLLYVLELYADGAKPVVHVWKVQ